MIEVPSRKRFLLHYLQHRLSLLHPPHSRHGVWLKIPDAQLPINMNTLEMMLIVTRYPQENHAALSNATPAHGMAAMVAGTTRLGWAQQIRDVPPAAVNLFGFRKIMNCLGTLANAINTGAAPPLQMKPRVPSVPIRTHDGVF